MGESPNPQKEETNPTRITMETGNPMVQPKERELKVLIPAKPTISGGCPNRSESHPMLKDAVKPIR
jgi:hypothetical protein